MEQHGIHCGANLLTIKLQYTNDVTSWRLFTIFTLNVEDCEFERRMKTGLAGNCVETPIGYRRKVTIDFAPLKDDKQALFFLFAWCLSNKKEVVYYTNSSGHIFDPGFDSYGNPLSGDVQTIEVAYIKNEVQFQHEKNAYFGNGFSLELIESNLQQIEDDESVRIFKPIYTPVGGGITGNTFTCYVNLVDQSSIEIQKYPIRFIHGNQETRDYGYRHAFEIDTGAITTAEERNWIRDFCLCKNKQIDTTAIDSYNGRVFNVVYADEYLQWKFTHGIQEAKTVVLKFKEKVLRTLVEEYTSVPSPYHEFILDTDQLDDTNIIIG